MIRVRDEEAESKNGYKRDAVAIGMFQRGPEPVGGGSRTAGGGF